MARKKNQPVAATATEVVAAPVTEVIAGANETQGQVQGEPVQANTTDTVTTINGEAESLEVLAGGGGDFELSYVATAVEAGDAPEPVKASGKFLIEVDPDSLLIDPDLESLRIWNGYSSQEDRIPELGRTIWENGQSDPALAYETQEGLVLYDGHRRRKAVMWIRDEFDATFPLQVLVDPTMTPEQALRAALLADSQHEHFTEIERGRNVKFLRSHFDGWDQPSGTDKVAEFLGVSAATVRNAEKLYNAPANIRQLVESGQITVSNAVDMIAASSNLPAEDQARAQEQIADRARQLAEEEASISAVGSAYDDADMPLPVDGDEEYPGIEAETGLDSFEEDEEDADDQTDDDEGVEGGSSARPLTASQSAAAKRVREAAKADKAKRTADGKAKVERRHVRAAAKQVLGDKAKTKVPRVLDVVELVEPWTGPAYPPLMQKFAATFVEYLHAKTSDSAVEKAWDELAKELRKASAAVDKVTEAVKASVEASVKPSAKPDKSDKSKAPVKKSGGKK